MEIDKTEIRKYLGYGRNPADSHTEKLIDRCLAESERHRRLLQVHHTFPISFTEKGVIVDSENLILKGASIRSHLDHSKYCVLMAATLGPEIDRLIRYMSRTDLTGSLVMDAVATATVEAFLDRIEEKIRTEAKQVGLFATTRFSPGYGDLPLDIQPALLRILDAPRSIGLTVTDSFLLTPRKSVTAIIGLQETPATLNAHGCSICTADFSCRYKEEEIPCEHSAE